MNGKEYKDQVRAEEREGLYGEGRKREEPEPRSNESIVTANLAPGRRLWSCRKKERAGEEGENKSIGSPNMACTFRARGAWRTRRSRRKAHVSISGQRKMREEGKEESRKERTRGRVKDGNTKETHSLYAYPQPPFPIFFLTLTCQTPSPNRGNSLARECRSTAHFVGWMDVMSDANSASEKNEYYVDRDCGDGEGGGLGSRDGGGRGRTRRR
ncbi:hypothetical protein B0H14DRAFT_2613951 [Mycena olivaceomarginata]|nr:hypothetical protein B0H14DRAFT_2613951 [Mycena olivaceomarginata]